MAPPVRALIIDLNQRISLSAYNTLFTYTCSARVRHIYNNDSNSTISCLGAEGAPSFFANIPDYVEKNSVFNKPIYWNGILPLFIFKWLMVVMQAICIIVLLVGTFDIVLNNVGEPREGSLGSIIKNG